MSELKCPYCNAQISKEEDICHVCGKDLKIQCPYCRQYIKAYDEICPCCSSKLIKKDCSKILMILGTIISTIWVLVNIGIVALFHAYPQIFKIQSKNSDTFMVADYLHMCGFAMLLQISLFIVALMIQTKVKKAAITGIIINILFFIAFVAYALYVKYNFM